MPAWLPTEHGLTFVLAALVVIVVPGPSVLFVVSRALTLGPRAGVATVVGNNLGVFTQVVLVALGVGAVVERSAALYAAIKLGGALYLVYLGLQAIRHRRSLVEALDRPPSPRTRRRILREAYVVGVANPKAIVFFAAVLPQFAQRQAGHVELQLLVLGGLFCSIGALSDTAWALAAGAARGWLVRSRRRLEAIGAGGGAAMVGLGASLAVAGRPQP